MTVTASDATATIGTSDTGAFTFSRTGDTSTNLTVSYTLGGTAVARFRLLHPARLHAHLGNHSIWQQFRYDDH